MATYPRMTGAQVERAAALLKDASETRNLLTRLNVAGEITDLSLCREGALKFFVKLSAFERGEVFDFLHRLLIGRLDAIEAELEKLGVEG